MGLATGRDGREGVCDGIRTYWSVGEAGKVDSGRVARSGTGGRWLLFSKGSCWNHSSLDEKLVGRRGGRESRERLVSAANWEEPVFTQMETLTFHPTFSCRQAKAGRRD